MTWRWPWVSRALYDAAVASSAGLAHMRDAALVSAEERVLRVERRYDDLVARYNEARRDEDLKRAVLQDSFSDERHRERNEFEARYNALLANYHALKLQGASVPEPAPVLPEKAHDPVLTAVNNACAGKDASVRTAMLKQVMRDRNAEVSDADIILRIQRGNRPAEEVA